MILSMSLLNKTASWVEPLITARDSAEIAGITSTGAGSRSIWLYFCLRFLQHLLSMSKSHFYTNAWWFEVPANVSVCFRFDHFVHHPSFEQHQLLKISETSSLNLKGEHGSMVCIAARAISRTENNYVNSGTANSRLHARFCRYSV